MNPAAIALIIGLVEQAIRLRPILAEELNAIFTKPDPNPSDWYDLKVKVLSDSFERLAPDAKLK